MLSLSGIFCLKCGSSLVDVTGWEHPGKAIVECSECGNTTTLNGFSLGRTHIQSESFIKAVKDVAIYGRNPEIIKLIRGKAKQELVYDQ